MHRWPGERQEGTVPTRMTAAVNWASVGISETLKSAASRCDAFSSETTEQPLLQGGESVSQITCTLSHSADTHNFLWVHSQPAARRLLRANSFFFFTASIQQACFTDFHDNAFPPYFKESNLRWKTLELIRSVTHQQLWTGSFSQWGGSRSEIYWQ